VKYLRLTDIFLLYLYAAHKNLQRRQEITFIVIYLSNKRQLLGILSSSSDTVCTSLSGQYGPICHISGQRV